MSRNRKRRSSSHASHRAAKEQRALDRALCPGEVSARLGMKIFSVAAAMRAAGVEEQLTLEQAEQWMTDLETAPDWFTGLIGERLAAAAIAEFERVRAEEEWQMEFLLIEKSAADKVASGTGRFTGEEWDYVLDWAYQVERQIFKNGPGVDISDYERQLLRLVGVDPDNHETWELHTRGCDGIGAAHCQIRIEKKRVESLLDSIAKETTLKELGFVPGETITTWNGARVGVVVKTNRVTVKIRTTGTRSKGYVPVERNVDPRYVQRATDAVPATPAVGDAVTIRDYGGHVRTVTVVATDGPLFEATYVLKSKQCRRVWFDVTMLQAAKEPVAQPN